MSDESKTSDKARPMGFSGYARHEALVEAIRIERGKRDGKVPKASVVFQDAIEELGLRELGATRFAQVTAKAA